MAIPREFFEIIKETKKFAKQEFGPDALDMDLNPDSNRIFSLWKKSTALDIPALLIPEKFGGVGCEPVCGALILDALAGQCAGVASIFAHHFAGCFPISFGTQAQKSRFFKELAGPKIAGVIFDNSDDENSLTLEKSGKNILISGRAPLSANVAYADLFCVFVAEKKSQISCVMVKKDAPGLSIGQDAEIPGLKANPFYFIKFDNVKITPQAVIGKQGHAAKIMEDTQNLLYAYTAAMALGAAKNAYEKAFAYAKERYQFGKIIIKHQEIRRMLGAMLMKLNIGTTAYINWFDDETPLTISKNAALIKAFCTDAAFEIALDAVQIHGGSGYMHEQGVEKIMRDTKVLQVLGGSNPKHLVDAVG